MQGTKKTSTRYIAVREGEGPGVSRTIFATSDPETVAAVVRVIRERLGDEPNLIAGDKADA